MIEQSKTESLQARDRVHLKAKFLQAQDRFDLILRGRQQAKQLRRAEGALTFWVFFGCMGWVSWLALGIAWLCW